MSRPTKQEAVLIAQRNKKIKAMARKGYPVDYISGMFNLSKGRVSRIINEVPSRSKKKETKNSYG